MEDMLNLWKALVWPLLKYCVEFWTHSSGGMLWTMCKNRDLALWYQQFHKETGKIGSPLFREAQGN